MKKNIILYNCFYKIHTITTVIILQFFILHITSLSAQNTVGVTKLEQGVSEGYTFFSNFSGTNAYLIDNCGRLINEWDRDFRPGLAAYFLDNGLMLRTYKPPVAGPFTSASNAGGIELVDWENNTVWDYTLNSQDQLTHHDAVMMPNGHVLVLSWQLEFEEDLIAWGRNPQEIAPQGFMWSEKIIEIDPIYPNGGNIIWEWNIKDHYIQDFDASKANFGVVEDHPELFDINLPDINSSNSNASRDWNHFNAIDYNRDLDQIAISTRNSDEIWILDHSTTTEQAASHSGGRYGKGGDILYRWGNASAYRQAPVSDQKLFGQHGVHWIKEGLVDQGGILIYNNGNGRPGPDYSTIEILFPPQDSAGFYIYENDQPFGPQSSELQYGSANGTENFYSPFLSNAQRLSNGNTLINNGSNGIVFEVTPEREIVWEYKIPLNGDFALSQGQSHNGAGATFRAYKFAPDFPGFDGLTLEPTDVIEVDFDPEPCLISNTISTEESTALLIFDPSAMEIRIEPKYEQGFSIRAINDIGQLLAKSTNQQVLQLPDNYTGLFHVICKLESGKIIRLSNIVF